MVKEALECFDKAASQHCGQETADWLTTYIKTATQPALNEVGCKLSGKQYQKLCQKYNSKCIKKCLWRNFYYCIKTTLKHPTTICPVSITKTKEV